MWAYDCHVLCHFINHTLRWCWSPTKGCRCFCCCWLSWLCKSHFVWLLVSASLANGKSSIWWGRNLNLLPHRWKKSRKAKLIYWPGQTQKLLGNTNCLICSWIEELCRFLLGMLKNGWGIVIFKKKERKKNVQTENY